MKNLDIKISFSIMALLIILVGIFQSWGVALSILNLCLISAVMSMGVNIQWGFAGLINFGVMGFLAIGGLATVLVSVPPVIEAWSAGGMGILLSGVFIISVVLVLFFINKKFSGYKYKNYLIFLIIILSIPLLKLISGPSISKIESINAATSGITSVAITYVNTDYGVGLADVYEAAAEARGIEVTAKTAHEGDKADYSAEVGVLSAAGGDALAVIGYLDQGGNQIIQGSLDSGAFDTFVLSDGMIGDSLTDTFGSDLDGSFGSMPGSLGAGAQKFKAYAEANGVNPSVYVGESYDAAALIVLAMALGGSDDSATVAANIMSVANGPGTKIYAGELSKGLELASAGFAVDYDGATDVNFTDVGEAFGAFIEKGIEGGAFTDAAQR